MRRLPLVLLVVLVTVSCATRSDRVTAVPSVPTSLVPNGPGDVGTGRCTFSLGGGLGAVISDVIADGPSAGVLFPDDIIVAFGGDPVRTSADLVTAVQSRPAGEPVEVSVLRDGEELTVEVSLGSSAEGRTLLGVLVATFEDQVEPVDLPATTIDSPLARPVVINGGLWLLDPTEVAWLDLGAAAPEGALIALDGEVYTVEVRAATTATVIAAISGEVAEIDLIEWTPVSVIGSLGRYGLIGTERTEADGTVVHAIIAVDPVAGTAEWAWITDPTSEFPVPVVGHRSLDGSRILVGLGTVDEALPERWVLLSEENGQPVAALARGVDDAAVLGWHDDDRVIAIVGDIGEVALIDPDTATSAQTTMPVEGEPAGLWPVGDGEHILVGDDQGLVLATVGDIERRALTTSCGTALVADLGWNGA